MFGIPLDMGYMWLQFWQTIAPSVTWIWKKVSTDLKKRSGYLFTSIKTWWSFWSSSSSIMSGCSGGSDVSPTSMASHEPLTQTCYAFARTCFAAFTNAVHSNRDSIFRMKSGLNSASCSSTWTSWNTSGKLFVVHPLTWHASKLWVISRTMVAVNIASDEKVCKIVLGFFSKCDLGLISVSVTG